MLRRILTIATTELLVALRDRRSLMSALAYGVWGPLVMALALAAMARDRQEENLSLPVSGRHLAPSLAAFLTERMVNVVDLPGDGAIRPYEDERMAAVRPGEDERMANAVRAREWPVALAVSHDYGADFAGGRPAAVTLLFDGSRADSRRKAERVRTLLAEYGRRVATTRLVLRGVSPAVVSPLDVNERDLSTAATRAAAALATLPMFVLLAVFVGGMGVAADTTAGERERGSLESLLLAPLPPRVVVGGKWLATTALALATLTVAIGVSHWVLRHRHVQAIDLPVGLSAGEATGIWLLLVPLAMLVAVVQVLLAMTTRSFKEAQTHLSLLIFVPMVPGFLLAFGTLSPEHWMTAVPILGQHLLVADIVRGQPLDAFAVTSLSLVTLAATAAGLALASRLLVREAMLLRTGT
jgi:sodium transport system permease protein